MARSPLLVALFVLLAACGGHKSSAQHIQIAAAADLAMAFEEVGKAFEARTGIHPTFSFGSTGLLAKQVEEGAPFDLFAAANIEFVDRVVAAGACDGGTKTLYARGRIVVWTKGPAPARLEDLADATRYKQISIANPDHAPYGRAAKQALEKIGIWDQVKDRVVQGENVQQALQYAQSGNVDAAIVALSLSTVSKGGSSLAIDPALYAPLEQALVVCGKGPGAASAKAFADFVGSPDGREIMNRYGFLLPGESDAAKAPDRTGGDRRPPPTVDAAAVQATVDAWLKAQNDGDFAAYQALYADRFGGVRRVGAKTWRFDRKGWLADRGKMFKAPMKVAVAGIEIHPSAGSAVVRFEQTFESGKFKDTGPKQLVIVESGDGLRIAREEMLQSTIVEGKGSARATGFAVVSVGQPWLVVGDGAGVETVGKPTLTAGGGAFDYAVLQDTSTLAPAWAKLIGQEVTLHPSGSACSITGFRVLTLLSPHFGTVAEWNGDTDGDGEPDQPPLAGDALAQAVLDGGGATYLVADLSGCARFDGDVVGAIGAARPPWTAVADPALDARVLAAFEALPEHAAIQDEFVQDFGGQGAWTDSDDASFVTRVARSPDGKQTYALVAAHAGVGCGDFQGDLVELFRLDGDALTPVATLASDGAGSLPTALVDTNGDGRPEVAGFASLWAWDGKTYAPAYSLDLGFRDCGC
jgi:molybdate transport system substrate-binding protein